MKKIYIIHGWGGKPHEHWMDWLEGELKKLGFEVLQPEMPNTDKPEIGAWVNHLREAVGTPNRETYFVGHSIAARTIFRYLETLPEDIKVGDIVLIAPWIELDMQSIEEEGEESVKVVESWIRTPINFEKIRPHLSKVTAIFSDNDPYVPIEQKLLFEKELGAKIIVEHNKGHFTSGEGVAELPSALEAVRGMF